ncbi:unnamed protein product, partial [Ilex paraguariensis]
FDGCYWPLTTCSSADRAPRFKFVSLTVSFAPPEPSPSFYLIYCLAPWLHTAPTAHYNSLLLG